MTGQGQPDGTSAEATSVRATGQTATVYNFDFEVEGLQDYYVKAGNTWILVHNACGAMSMDEAIERRVARVRGTGEMIESGSGGFQFISHSIDTEGTLCRRLRASILIPHQATCISSVHISIQ